MSLHTAEVEKTLFALAVPQYSFDFPEQGISHLFCASPYDP